MTIVSLNVNGTEVRADVPPRLHLADFLREKLLLTGTHLGCEHGVCGACTVEIDGDIARSCITYAVACDGTKVRTIEGFDEDILMEQLRQAFSRHHALQCGYCTPGMLIAARDLLQRKSNLDRAAIRIEMSGNLCRCTGYMGIVDAIAQLMGDDVAATSSPITRLGPAPGPLIAATATTAPGQYAPPPPATSKARPSPPSQAPSSLKRAKIAVSLDPVRVDSGATHLRQTFEIDHSRDAIWQLLRDPAKAAALIPGVTLDSVENDLISGHLALRLGPIKATFAGQGVVQRADADYRQVISGRGSDDTGSIADGQIACVLYSRGAATTLVEITLSYSIRGLLAQFGRSYLIHDFVAQIGEQFAGNLDAALSSGNDGLVGAAEFSPLPLLWKAVLGQLRRRLFPRR